MHPRIFELSVIVLRSYLYTRRGEVFSGTLWFMKRMIFVNEAVNAVYRVKGSREDRESHREHAALMILPRRGA